MIKADDIVAALRRSQAPPRRVIIERANTPELLQFQRQHEISPKFAADAKKRTLAHKPAPSPTIVHPIAYWVRIEDQQKLTPNFHYDLRPVTKNEGQLQTGENLVIHLPSGRPTSAPMKKRDWSPDKRVEASSDDIVSRRYEELTGDPHFRSCVDQWWDIVPKDLTGNIPKSEYVHIYMRIQRILLPQCDAKACRQAADRDWETNGGGVSMNYGRFFWFLVAVSAAWCRAQSFNSFAYIVEYLFRMVQERDAITSRYVDLSGRPVDREDVDFAWAKKKPASATLRQRTAGYIDTAMKMLEARTRHDTSGLVRETLRTRKVQIAGESLGAPVEERPKQDIPTAVRQSQRWKALRKPKVLPKRSASAPRPRSATSQSRSSHDHLQHYPGEHLNFTLPHPDEDLTLNPDTLREEFEYDPEREIDLNQLTPRSRMFAIEPWLRQIHDRQISDPPALQAVPGDMLFYFEKPSSRPASAKNPRSARASDLSTMMGPLRGAGERPHSSQTPPPRSYEHLNTSYSPVRASHSIRPSTAAPAVMRREPDPESFLRKQRAISAGRVPSWKEHLPGPPPPSPTCSPSGRGFSFADALNAQDDEIIRQFAKRNASVPTLALKRVDSEQVVEEEDLTLQVEEPSTESVPVIKSMEDDITTEPSAESKKAEETQTHIREGDTDTEPVQQGPVVLTAFDITPTDEDLSNAFSADFMMGRVDIDSYVQYDQLDATLQTVDCQPVASTEASPFVNEVKRVSSGVLKHVGSSPQMRAAVTPSRRVSVQLPSLTRSPSFDPRTGGDIAGVGEYSVQPGGFEVVGIREGTNSNVTVAPLRRRVSSGTVGIGKQPLGLAVERRQPVERAIQSLDLRIEPQQHTRKDSTPSRLSESATDQQPRRIGTPNTRPTTPGSAPQSRSSSVNRRRFSHVPLGYQLPEGPTLEEAMDGPRTPSENSPLIALSVGGPRRQSTPTTTSLVNPDFPARTGSPARRAMFSSVGSDKASPPVSVARKAPATAMAAAVEALREQKIDAGSPPPPLRY